MVSVDYEPLKKLILDNNEKTAEAIEGLKALIKDIDSKIISLNDRIQSLEDIPEPEPVTVDLEPIKSEIEHIKQIGNQNNEHYKNLVVNSTVELKEKSEDLSVRLQALINILTKDYGEKLGSGIKGEEYKLKQQIHKELKDMKANWVEI